MIMSGQHQIHAHLIERRMERSHIRLIIIHRIGRTVHQYDLISFAALSEHFLHIRDLAGEIGIIAVNCLCVQVIEHHIADLEGIVPRCGIGAVIRTVKHGSKGLGVKIRIMVSDGSCPDPASQVISEGFIDGCPLTVKLSAVGNVAGDQIQIRIRIHGFQRLNGIGEAGVSALDIAVERDGHIFTCRLCRLEAPDFTHMAFLADLIVIGGIGLQIRYPHAPCFVKPFVSA